MPYIGITPFQITAAAVTLVVGYIVTKILVGLFKNSLRKTKLPLLVVEFLARFFSAMLYVSVILVAVGVLGVSIGPVILGLSAVIGLILGFGLQDTLMNLAAGLWIAALGPIDIDEVVSISGQTGKVNSIGLMATELLTPDNTIIMIPNRLVWGAIIINHTRMPTRRVGIDIGVAYGTNLDRAIQLAMELMKSHPKVLNEPEPSVVITALADSSINLQLRAWTKTEDYWEVKGDLTRGIYELYTKEGIEIPFPQVDVHIREMSG
ncbi:mechanosensitive ion channel family protein [Thermococcus sp. GR7]|uniref:mechanosensitive ion channel family protein n=1 Tax=unclassified Thermococcus TaxID=2627626 RepID=UPI00143165C0|nr:MULTISPECIES: mechanosensitive ion channel family protein [unclassified Thermococcus]NJE47645.1 mechanosensitive ion channel family protein [Thermococcus sp. GR7]NJE78941.1 mechanosensitive ion channel family protein [Thermococcus sp. GR4]NJF22591.1 mechanosensitive ion channel family protein [Thermococcus sp. GR5]